MTGIVPQADASDLAVEVHKVERRAEQAWELVAELYKAINKTPTWPTTIATSTTGFAPSFTLINAT
jgi:hypothetical protein